MGETTIEESPQKRFKKINKLLGRGSYKSVYVDILDAIIFGDLSVLPKKSIEILMILVYRYISFDQNEGHYVAWSDIPINGISTKEKKRLLNELNILKEIDNEHLIHYFASWYNEDQEKIVLITELVDGSLDKFIKDHPVTVSLIKTWSKQILSGLNYLHSHDPPIIHRDIKCTNIFWNSQKECIKIGDLGVSVLSNKNEKMSIVGTPEFMAPEIFAGEEYNTKADIYAFGMCLLEMYTQEIPFSECQTIPDVYRKVTQSEMPVALEKIKDEKTKDFIRILLSRNPDDRPTAEELLKNPFFDPEEDDSKVIYDPFKKPMDDPDVQQSLFEMTKTDGCKGDACLFDKSLSSELPESLSFPISDELSVVDSDNPPASIRSDVDETDIHRPPASTASTTSGDVNITEPETTDSELSSSEEGNQEIGDPENLRDFSYPILYPHSACVNTDEMCNFAKNDELGVDIDHPTNNDKEKESASSSSLHPGDIEKMDVGENQSSEPSDLKMKPLPAQLNQDTPTDPVTPEDSIPVNSPQPPNSLSNFPISTSTDNPEESSLRKDVEPDHKEDASVPLVPSSSSDHSASEPPLPETLEPSSSSQSNQGPPSPQEETENSLEIPFESTAQEKKEENVTLSSPSFGHQEETSSFKSSDTLPPPDSQGVLSSFSLSQSSSTISQKSSESLFETNSNLLERQSPPLVDSSMTGTCLSTAVEKLSSDPAPLPPEDNQEDPRPSTPPVPADSTEPLVAPPQESVTCSSSSSSSVEEQKQAVSEELPPQEKTIHSSSSTPQESTSTSTADVSTDVPTDVPATTSATTTPATTSATTTSPTTSDAPPPKEDIKETSSTTTTSDVPPPPPEDDTEETSSSTAATSATTTPTTPPTTTSPTAATTSPTTTTSATTTSATTTPATTSATPKEDTEETSPSTSTSRDHDPVTIPFDLASCVEYYYGKEVVRELSKVTIKFEEPTTCEYMVEIKLDDQIITVRINISATKEPHKFVVIVSVGKGPNSLTILRRSVDAHSDMLKTISSMMVGGNQNQITDEVYAYPVLSIIVNLINEFNAFLDSRQ